MRGMRIEYHNTVATDEAGHICQIVHRVESESKAPYLVGLALLGGARELADVLEVVVGKHGIVVDLEVDNRGFEYKNIRNLHGNSFSLLKKKTVK